MDAQGNDATILYLFVYVIYYRILRYTRGDINE